MRRLQLRCRIASLRSPVRLGYGSPWRRFQRTQNLAVRVFSFVELVYVLDGNCQNFGKGIVGRIPVMAVAAITKPSIADPVVSLWVRVDIDARLFLRVVLERGSSHDLI